MTTNALRIPGIQDSPEDWAQLAQEFRGSICIDSTLRNTDPTNLSREEWMTQMMADETEALQRGGHEILIAHSYGAHRAIDLVQQCTSIKAAVLLNPARNHILERSIMEPNQTHAVPRSQRGPRTTTENLLWNVSLDMTDKTFENFAKRHEQMSGAKSERRKLARLFEFLRNGIPAQERLEAYQGTAPLLVIQSSDDPWRVENLHATEFVRIVELERKMHYPHVSDPEKTATVIRDWLQEIGILTTEFQAPTYTDSMNQVTDAPSLVS